MRRPLCKGTFISILWQLGPTGFEKLSGFPRCFLKSLLIPGVSHSYRPSPVTLSHIHLSPALALFKTTKPSHGNLFSVSFSAGVDPKKKANNSTFSRRQGSAELNAYSRFVNPSHFQANALSWCHLMASLTCCWVNEWSSLSNSTAPTKRGRYLDFLFLKDDSVYSDSICLKGTTEISEFAKKSEGSAPKRINNATDFLLWKFRGISRLFTL